MWYLKYCSDRVRRSSNLLGSSSMQWKCVKGAADAAFALGNTLEKKCFGASRKVDPASCAKASGMRRHDLRLCDAGLMIGY
jgi:hypothetical protein